MKLIILIDAVALITGCAAVVERSDRAAERVGDRVAEYCETTSAESREALRSRVDDAAGPHSVEVVCDE